MCLISVSYNTVLLTGVTEILCGLLCKQLVPCNMSVTVFPSLKFSCLFAITENNQPFYIPKGFHSLSVWSCQLHVCGWVEKNKNTARLPLTPDVLLSGNSYPFFDPCFVFYISDKMHAETKFLFQHKYT